jgi:hypothetical protein
MNDVAGKHVSESARLLELRAAKAKREEALKAAELKREREELELDEKYSSKLGLRGVDFEIINTAKGLFVVRKPDFTVAKKYNSIPLNKQTEEDVWNYVIPHLLEPQSDLARAIMQEHGGIVHRCAIALHNLYGANGPEGRTGKF